MCLVKKHLNQFEGALAGYDRLTFVPVQSRALTAVAFLAKVRHEVIFAVVTLHMHRVRRVSRQERAGSARWG